MIVRRKGGMTEFIPSPQEKWDGLIRDHALGLLEQESGLPPRDAEAFTALLTRMKADESRNLELHNSLIAGETASG